MKLKVKLTGTSAYSPSKALVETKQNNEDYTAFEQRIWREKSHYNSKGEVVLPIFAAKAMLDSTASFLGEKVKGAGNKTYAKLFRAGIILQGENPKLMVNGKSIRKQDLDPDEHSEWVFCHSDGKRGGTAGRVHRLFPKFENWSVEFDLNAIESRLTEEVIARHLVAAGLFNGLGRFRPQNGGYLGRFEVEINGKKINSDVKTDNLPEVEAEEE
jgi:hypothetical protein